VPSAAAEHKTKETFSCFVEVPGKCQTFIERWFGGPQNYRLSIHMVFLSRTSKLSGAVCPRPLERLVRHSSVR